jgi:hypothetical protein
MHQFVHQREELLLRVQVGAQRDEVVNHAALHSVGQRGANQAGADALDVGFQGLDVVEDGGHRSSPCWHSGPIMRAGQADVDPDERFLLRRKLKFSIVVY